MTTLAARDTSGILQAQAGETEELRTRGAKRFRLADAPDGRRRYRVGASVGPVHYRQDPFDVEGAWEEIDLDVVLTPNEAWDAACESNGYQVRFWQTLTRGAETHRYVAQFRRGGRWLGMAPKRLIWTNNAGAIQTISTALAVGAPTINNEANFVQWDDVFGSGLHFRYNLQPDKFFKSLVITNKSDLPTPTIPLAGLRLVLVMALEWDFGASTNNAFAQGVETTIGAGDTFTGWDEELIDPARFSFLDGRGDLWWAQAPMAWDSAEEVHSVPVTWRLARKDGAVYGLFSVTGADLNNAAVVYPVYVDTAISEEVVGAGSDDGYETSAGISSTTTNFYMNRNQYNYGLVRFTTIPIPQGATISAATLTLNEVSYDDPNCNIYCDDVDDAPTLTGAAGSTDISSRTRTTATVQWIDTSLVSPSTSPDLSALVEEVVARVGWVSGQAIAFITTNIDETQRYNCITYESSATDCAKFNATYTEAAGGGFIPSWAINSNVVVQ